MNVMQVHEFARRFNRPSHHILSLSLHPGALSTGVQKNAPGWLNAILGLLRKEPRFGALTELWAGLRELGEGDEKMIHDRSRNGGYVVPWGRWGDGSKEVFSGLMERKTGERLWSVCEELVKDFI
jgi:retinol dehydrogenase-12